jgi:hypothetical protein
MDVPRFDADRDYGVGWSFESNQGQVGFSKGVAGAAHVLCANGSLTAGMEANVACRDLQYTQKCVSLPHRPAVGNACPLLRA